MQQLKTTEITVKLFGPLRDIVGKDEVPCHIPDVPTGETVFAELVREHPDLLPWRDHLMLAVNLTYVPFDHPVTGADDVAFIPPVSGG